jgi:hypothetical protein
MRKQLLIIAILVFISSSSFASTTLVKRFPSDTPVVVAPLSGSTVNGDCVQFDSSGNIVDSGAACGGGGSGTPAGSTNTIQYNAGGGNFGAVSLNATATDKYLRQVSSGVGSFVQIPFTDLSGTLGVSQGGTGTATAFTQGSSIFAGASGVYSQDNANYFWDATNHRLGLGTTSPAAQLDDDMNTSSGTSDLIQAWRWIGDVADYGLRLYQRHTGSSIVYDLEIRNNSVTDLPALTFKADGSVGVDNTAPAKTLDVTGTIGVSGHTTFEGVTSTGATGTGKLVYDGSPTLVTPNIGTPSAGVATNLTGTASGLTAGAVTVPAALGSSTATTQTQADNSTKLATTAYVDRAVLGQNYKEAVKYASIAALPSIIYANGSSGVGATLTGVALAAISLDSSSPSVNDRVLIKNQASSFQNGIYTVTATGSGIAVFVLTRATDADSSVEYKTGDSVFVTAGSTLANTTWAYTGVDSPTIGTDAITYAQVAGPGSFTAGNGISISGVSIAIDTSVTVDKTTAQTLTNKTLTTPIISSISNTGTITLPTSTDTLVGKATTDTFTNKTYDTAGTGNSFSINGVAATANTGTGSVVRATSPTLVTPTLGVATATSINKVAFTAPSTAATFAFGTDNTTQTFQGTDTIVGRATTDTLTNKTPSYAVASGAGTTIGSIITLTSTETQAVGDAVQIDSSGHAHLAKADTIGHASAVLIAAAAVSGSGSNTYLLPGGTMKLASSPSWTVGGLVFLSTTGTTTNTLTQSAPSGANNSIQVIGVAVAADTLLFEPALSQVEHS